MNNTNNGFNFIQRVTHMKRIVLTTSSAGLDELQYEHSDIGIIRLHVKVDDQDYIDGKTINNNNLREYIAKHPNARVTTTSATRSEIGDLFTRLHQQGYDEIFITSISSQVSDSFKKIKQVSYAFRQKMKFYVYDCKDMNVCETMMALEANRLLKQGENIEDIPAYLDKIRHGHEALFSINDDNYYKHRVESSTIGFLAKKLHFTPLLSVDDDGNVIEVSKARSLNQTLNYMVKYFEPIIQNRKCFPYVISSSDPDTTDYFVSSIKEAFNIDVPVFPVSSVSLADYGANTIGLCAFSGVLPQALVGRA